MKPRQPRPPVPEDLPFRWHRGNDGRLHIHFEEDVVVHYHGNKTEEINGGSITYTKGTAVQIAQMLHTQPMGEALFKYLIEPILNNTDVADSIREIMKTKEANFREMERRAIKEMNKHPGCPIDE